MFAFAQQPGELLLQGSDQMRSHRVVVVAATFPAVPLGLGSFQPRQCRVDLFGGGHV